MRAVLSLVSTAHPGPALAVTVLAGLLGVAGGLSATDVVLVVLAVGTGQLSIGWSNDLIDRRRDETVGRADKPLATGAASPRVVTVACAVALVATVPLSLVTSALHLVVVAGGWAYNLGLKATALSWLPYAVAFAALPAYVVRVGGDPVEAWVPVAGGLLGVGAHFLNVIPDLADDAATGVRGLPHRLGARGSQLTAAVLLLAAAVVVALGAGLAAPVTVVVLVAAVALAGVAVTTQGRTPFRAAVAMALVDVVVLVWSR
jgi:4-hydroxybenzoate polyprenyltransferase